MSGFIVWQGFEHEWKREVLGFRLAHRLSSLVNYIDEDGALVAGASPGVDGNFMHPECFYRRVEAPGVKVTHRVVELSGTDRLVGDEAVLELSSALEYEGDAGANVDAILSGIDLVWSCDESKQPAGKAGNSNAVWPAELEVAVDRPIAWASTHGFRVRVRVVRAWTPMRGGVPIIEEKPLNVAMDLRARIHLQVLEGAPEAISLERLETRKLSGRRLRDSQRQHCPGRVLAHEREISGLNQFKFSMPARKPSGPLRHRGRYLSAIGFGVQDRGQSSRTWGRLWAPRSVVSSEVDFEVTTTALRFGEGATLGEPRSARARVHSNSSDQAPFFSHWKKFDSDQTRARVPIE